MKLLQAHLMRIFIIIFFFCISLLLFIFFAQVESIQEFAGRLKGEYAGDKLVDILQKEDEVIEAWKILLECVGDRNSKLGQSDEYQRLIVMIHNLLLWIEDMRLKMESDDQPKYVSTYTLTFLRFHFYF